MISVGEQRKGNRPVDSPLHFRQTRAGVALFGAVVVAGASIVLSSAVLNWLSRVSLSLGSTSAQEPTTPLGVEVAEVLNAPDVQLADEDFIFVQRDSGVFDGFVEPFAQIRELSLLAPVVWGLTAVGIALLLFIALRLLGVPLARRRMVAATLVLFGVGGAFLLYGVSASSGGYWDEAFVFASSAENFRDRGVAAISIDGDRRFAESSIDRLVPILAGSLLFFSSSLAVETSLALATLLLMTLIAVGIVVLLNSYFRVPAWGAVLAAAATSFLVPQAVLPLASGMPTGLAVPALGLFGLGLLATLVNGNPHILLFSGLAASLVRWDYAVLASCVSLALLALWNRVGIASKTSGKTTAVLVAIPVFLLVETITRKAMFGSWVPSGALGKSVGLDGAYLSNGWGFLEATLVESLWIGVVAVAIVLTLLVATTTVAYKYLAVVLVLAVPMFATVPAGGDWFPIEWARYSTPTVMAVVLVSFATVWISGISSRAKTVESFSILGLVGIVSVPFWLLGWSAFQGNAGQISGDFAAEPPPRVVCLARMGHVVKSELPGAKSLASAEVNTVAFFADKPLVDLFGIVDPRLAAVEPMPEMPGHPFHRRPAGEMMVANQPDVTYLYEGADCAGGSSDLASEKVAWNDLLNAGVTRYRIGGPVEVLSNYIPVSLVVDGEINGRVLVRRAFLEDECWKGDVQSDLCRRL